MKTRGRPRHPDVLTPREFEVLGLLREGLSNPEIAKRLGISRAGVKYHVSEILGKLDLSSRDEAALWRRETHRPWWAGALAPVAWLWSKAGAVAASPSAIATGAAGVVIGAAGAGLVFMAFLLATGEADSNEPEPSSRTAPTPTEAPGVLVTMNEVDGSGANGTVTLADFGPELVINPEFPTLGPELNSVPWSILPGTCATQPLTMPGVLEVPGARTWLVWSGPRPLDKPTDGFHHIVVFEAVANSSTVVSCGDIPAISADGEPLTEPVDFVHLTMSEQDGSGVAADVTLWPRPDGVGVAAVANVTFRWWYDFHVHRGACATGGARGTLVLGAWQSERADTEVPEGDRAVFRLDGVARWIEFASIRDGNHYIDAHAVSDGGTVVACADIPAA